MEIDPGEQNDLAASRPVVRDRLFEQLMAFHLQRNPVAEDRGLTPGGDAAPAVFGPSSEHD